MKSLIQLLFLIHLAVALAGLKPDAAFAGHHDESGPDNIVQTAAGAGQFETLLAAATAAGLAPALAGEGPFTVFAPTDEAFGALPAGTVRALLRAENRDRLAEILKLHVVPGRVGSDALADGAALDTLGGSPLRFTASEQGFTVEGARIVTTDIAASNGVIHVIDRVILPTEAMNARLSRAQARHVIDEAIARGVPMFNHGDPASTAAIYTDAATRLMASADLDDHERHRLQRGLRAGHHGPARERAWQLRYALDDVRESLLRSGDSLARADTMR